MAKISKALKFNLGNVDGCFVSHGHGDHAQAVKDLQKIGFDCIMSQQTATAIGRDGRHRTKIVRPLEWVSIGQWRVQPFALAHDRDVEGNLGYWIWANGESLLYMTDYRFTEYLLPVGLTHLAIACNYDINILKRNIANSANGDDATHLQRVIEAHPSIDTVLGILKANREVVSKLEAIHLLHISRGNGDPADFKRRVEAETGRPCFVS